MKVYLVYEGYGNDWIDGVWTEGETVTGVYSDKMCAISHLNNWANAMRKRYSKIEVEEDELRSPNFPGLRVHLDNHDEEYYCYITEMEILEEPKEFEE